MYLVLVVVLIVVIGGVFWKLTRHTYTSGAAGPSKSVLVQTASNAGTIRLLAAGDFIAHDSVNTAAKQPGG